MLLKIQVSKTDKVIPSMTFVEALRKSSKVWGGTSYKIPYPSLLSHLIAPSLISWRETIQQGSFEKEKLLGFLPFMEVEKT